MLHKLILVGSRRGIVLCSPKQVEQIFGLHGERRANLFARLIIWHMSVSEAGESNTMDFRFLQ